MTEYENTDKQNYPDYIEKIFELTPPPGQHPERLDRYLTDTIANATRTKVQKAIDAGCVTVNGFAAKASRKIQPGDLIVCKLMKAPPITLIPENIPLDIIYEDDYLLVVNKPAGMVTHPGFGNRHGTLVNAILYHTGLREAINFESEDDEEEITDEEILLSDAVRPGVVHRLDKETSGLLLVSKDPVTHAALASQFSDRTISREYYAIAWGAVKNDSGTFEGDIGRSPRDRKLFSVVKKDGKYAVTDYEIIERFDYLTFLKIKLRTGRTHQIRVHFLHNHYPLLGDSDYKGNSIVYGGNNQEFKKLAGEILKSISRQMLHAGTLQFKHPKSGETIRLESKLPDDMLKTLALIRGSL
ncbi:MAG: Pseudouridine synthase [Bacteroidota bacterium]|nr:Pseudouridine synthase [Bacteroidota bacterium]